MENKLMKIPNFVFSFFKKFHITKIQSVANLYSSFLVLFVMIIRTISSGFIHSFKIEIPSSLLLFWESFFGLIIFFVFIFVKKGTQSVKINLKTNCLILQILKAFCGMIGTYFLFEALKNIKLVTNSILSLSSVVFNTIGSCIFFKEKLTKNSFISIILICFGILMVVDFSDFSFSFYSIFAAFFFSCTTLLSKKIATSDGVQVSLFFVLFFQTVFMFFWSKNQIFNYFNFDLIFIMFVTAIIFLITNPLTLYAESFGNFVFLSPFKCARIPFSALIGFFFFNENLSFSNLVGIIFCVGSYFTMILNRDELTSYFVRNKLLK